MTLSVTTEFHAEFEAEREQWLRNRLVWYCGFMLGIALIPLLFSFIQLDTIDDALDREFLTTLGVRAGQAMLFGAAFVYAATRRRDLSRQRVLRIVNFCIIALGLLALLVVPLAASGIDALVSADDAAGVRVGDGAAWAFLLFVTHLSASLFIPWTPRESVRPMIPLLALATVVTLAAPLFTGDSVPAALFGAIMTWTIMLPGLAVAWLRHSRYRSRFHMRALTGRYGAIKRELLDARRIHEAIFPPQILEGPVRFAYRYEPMLQLGGDFVFLHPRHGGEAEDGSVSVALIDVTGHGIAAALTVNRLDGELARLYAETPGIEPGAVIEALNSYIHLTLAEHSVYATAFCARVDLGSGELAWANAGHPPGMLRDAAGRIEELVSTTFVLGAAAPGDYDARQETRRFGAGDALLLYTDGAFEARGRDGAMFTLNGLRKTLVRSAGVAAGRGGLAERVLQAVDEFRAGPPTDDTLILEISRPSSAKAAGPVETESAAAG